MISFIEQMKICRENGNLFEVEIPSSGKIALACAKYKTHCQSKACHNERLQPEDSANNICPACRSPFEPNGSCMSCDPEY